MLASGSNPQIFFRSRVCVISGWAARWIIVTARALSQSSSIGNREAWALLLFVWRRVRGSAGVRRLTGYDPSAPRPPGTREHYNASRQHRYVMQTLEVSCGIDSWRQASSDFVVINDGITRTSSLTARELPGNGPVLLYTLQVW
jgi:hypothetical protein